MIAQKYSNSHVNQSSNKLYGTRSKSSRVLNPPSQNRESITNRGLGLRVSVIVKINNK